MKILKQEEVVSQQQARGLAIEWQHWQADRSMSYGELTIWQEFFAELAEKFPDLIDEFKENGII